MTKINGPRYSDSNDFDEMHDKITLWLMNNYKEISHNIISKIAHENASAPEYDFINNENSVVKIDADINIESPLDRFNIPDAIVSGNFKVHHNGYLYFDMHEIITEDGHPTGKKEVSLHCPVCTHKVAGVYDNNLPYTLPYFTFPRSDGITPFQAINEIFKALTSMGIKCNANNQTNRMWADNIYCIEKEFTIVFEVKSHIKSFGEVMRQLQSYKSILNRHSEDFTHVVLVTPDARFNSYFEEQGFYVVVPNLDIADNRNTKSLEEFSGVEQ